MTDVALSVWVSSLVERARLNWMQGHTQPWSPGHKLRLLFAGYNGSRNTGSDVRVEEMLRQIGHILGLERIEMTVLTQDFRKTEGYFKNAAQKRLPDIFPPFLHREIPKYHGVVACEGSMFKSKFANALSTMMIGSLGIAAAQNKLSVGYGAEAGTMDRSLRTMCRRYCGQSLIITRNQESREILRKLGVPTERGTDTAWTFEPLGPEFADKTFREAGWDGVQPILVVCPINPFWWPVKPSLVKAAAHSFGAFKDTHYRSIYFHRGGKAVDAAFERYISAIAGAVDAFRQRHAVFPVMIATEALDTAACHEVSKRIGRVPVFSSTHFNMYELVSLLRKASMLASSRYHAIVTSMPAGVPSAGITMDERIANLLAHRNHDHLLMRVDDVDLQDRLLDNLETLHRDGPAITAAIRRAVVAHLKDMARMGQYFEEQVQHRYPDFELRGGIRPWEDYLPTLSRDLHDLLEEQAA